MDSNKEILIARECEKLILDIAWLTDHGPHSQIADLYTTSGSFDKDGEVTTGKAALEEMYKKRPASLFTRHVLSNIRIKVLSETEALATSYGTVFRYRSNDNSAPIPPVKISGPEIVSEYRDTFIRESGVMKISSRILKTMIQLK
jgi:hypothetical protein